MRIHAEDVMGNFSTGALLGFREGLEAFLIVVILLRFLRKSERRELIRSVRHGAELAVVLVLTVRI